MLSVIKEFLLTKLLHLIEWHCITGWHTGRILDHPWPLRMKIHTVKDGKNRKRIQEQQQHGYCFLQKGRQFQISYVILIRERLVKILYKN